MSSPAAGKEHRDGHPRDPAWPGVSTIAAGRIAEMVIMWLQQSAEPGRCVRLCPSRVEAFLIFVFLVAIGIRRLRNGGDFVSAADRVIANHAGVHVRFAENPHAAARTG